MKKLVLITFCALIAQSSAIFSINQHPLGRIHIITGPMCAGKSEETIRLMNKLLRAKKEVLAIKPGIDDRKLKLQDDQDPTKVISSRAGTSTECIPVTNVAMLEKVIQEHNPSHIVIDEVHFFTPEKEAFIALILALRQSGKQIILSGLDLNYRGEPFGPMPELLAYANSIEKLTANCAVCGDETACMTQRLVNGKPAPYKGPLIEVGDSQYEPRCTGCHECKKE